MLFIYNFALCLQKTKKEDGRSQVMLLEELLDCIMVINSIQHIHIIIRSSLITKNIIITITRLTAIGMSTNHGHYHLEDKETPNRQLDLILLMQNLALGGQEATRPMHRISICINP